MGYYDDVQELMLIEYISKTLNKDPQFFSLKDLDKYLDKSDR